VVVGDVKSEEVNALAEKYFSKWKQGDYTADVPLEPPQTENVKCICRMDLFHLI